MTTEPIRPIEEAVQRRWNAIAVDARKRRVGIEVRDGTAAMPYRVVGKERSEVEDDLGLFAKLDDAFLAAEAWVLERPLPGPIALRDELREHGRRLAVLTPRDVTKPRGQDFPLYRRFRDRILPLAWDNLVDSTKLEALESAVAELVDAVDAARGKKGGSILTSGELGVAIATLRGLLPTPEDAIAKAKGATDG